MEFVELASKKTDASSHQFWRALDIWSRNPHVENRRILTSDEILTVGTRENVSEIFKRVETLDLSSVDIENDIRISFLDALGLIDCHCLEKSSNFLGLSLSETYLRITKFLPRLGDLFSPGFEFTIVSPSSKEVTIIHKPISKDKRCLGPNMPYRISHSVEGFTRVNVKSSKNELSNQGDSWISRNLFPRLLKWMENELDHSPTIQSLSLIASEKYAKLYELLKKKYGSEMVKIWPENTDPKKFVYEDVAIATYLLVLWEKERLEKGIEKLQSFVDLGCGNGLLVHILTSEGHPGIGIDLRKRKIWDLFPCRDSLQVSTIVPSSMTLFPGTDWIIGNHSDELTPWVPVIAARTPPDCRFFLLPCCAYEFDGSKYQRNSASKSQYSDYIDYVKTICEGCGFKTELDRLRIPSTKRICLIGWKRVNDDEDISEKELRIQTIINERSSLTGKRNDLETFSKVDGVINNTWSINFKPRDTIEKVRNCTQIDKALQAEIINIVAEHLLRDGRRITLEELPGKCWNAGRELELSEIADIIPKEMLARLRNECGGLQTLLRNHGYIFNVSQGKVSFRQPGIEVKKRKRKKNSVPSQLKVRPCWFHQNHPDGCPRCEENCTFKH